MQALEHAHDVLQSAGDERRPGGRECFVVPVGGLLEHVVAELVELPGRSLRCRARLVVDGYAERGAEREANRYAHRRLPCRVDEVPRRRADPMMIARLVAGHHIERQRRVERRAGDRTVGRCSSADVAEIGANRDAAAARLQADDAAAGRRYPNRAAEVAALGQPDHARRDCGRATARGAAGGKLEVPRVAGHAEAGRLGDRSKPSSGVFVLPTTIAPASRSRRTCALSWSATQSPNAALPLAVGSPVVAPSRSLTASGTPQNGRASPGRIGQLRPAHAPDRRGRTR